MWDMFDKMSEKPYVINDWFPCQLMLVWGSDAFDQLISHLYWWLYFAPLSIHFEHLCGRHKVHVCVFMESSGSNLNHKKLAYWSHSTVLHSLVTMSTWPTWIQESRRQCGEAKMAGKDICREDRVRFIAASVVPLCCRFIEVWSLLSALCATWS